jgi:phage terminase large subunit-like protein
MRGLFDSLDIRQVGFDRWNWRHFSPWLEKAGFREEELARLVEFRQGYASMSLGLCDLESDLLNQKFAHGNHPVLAMCAANAVVHQDPAGNLKPAKDKSTERIDGIVALIMAIGRALVAQEEPQPEHFMFFVGGNRDAAAPGSCREGGGNWRRGSENKMVGIRRRGQGRWVSARGFASRRPGAW